MTIRETLNRIFWDHRENREDYVVTFIHRGTYMDRKNIQCSVIKEVKASWFYYESGFEKIIIPFHRILEIKNIKSGKLVWEKTSVKKY